MMMMRMVTMLIALLWSGSDAPPVLPLEGCRSNFPIFERAVRRRHSASPRVTGGTLVQSFELLPERVLLRSQV